MISRFPKLRACLSFLLVSLAIAAAVPARAGDDTSRFDGTWQAIFPFNGQMITMRSVHDGNGYTNYVVTNTGEQPAGNGTFQAANGKYTTSAPYPNNAGVYHFIGNDTVVCVNAAGQTLTWKRYKLPRAASSPPGSSPSVPAGNPSPTPGPAANSHPGSASAPPGLAANPSLPPETNAAIEAFGRKDYNTAWREFMIAAQKGDSEAQAGIGAMLLNHINPPGTGYFAQCEKWLLLSANQGNTKGMTFLAKYYYTDGVNIAGGINPGVNNTPIPPALRAQAEKRFTLARQWYEKAADKGDGYAMGSLAIMLDAGVGGPRDPARAAQLRAGVSGHTDADFAKKATADPATSAMTVAWQSGHYQDALKTAHELASKGNSAGQVVIGRSFYTGVGSPQSYANALPWFQKAAAQNNPDAIFFLGLMYEWGRGVPQDVNKAQSLLDKAGSLGQRYAQMEAKGMRMEGEAAAQQARFAAVCAKAGGHADGPLCLVGEMAIDPY
ncbi:MAG TPA: tetratricopeptide repeat protein [Candidatus Acidoferrum sp.]|jgi:TPR repeat protein